jgi:murein DD-endopeptidase MepM/ murein hydrolase activator NlpD
MKAIAWIVFVFFVLVLINYGMTMTEKFFSYGGLALNQAHAGEGYDALPSIAVNFFDPSGVGMNYITQGYGRTPYAYLYINGWHNGIDIAADFGTPVYSPAAGTVLAAVDQDAYCPRIAFGKYIAVHDTNHLVMVFSHLNNFAVSVGQQIAKGALLGSVGPTGLETGPHLLVSIFKERGFSTTPAHGCGPYPQGNDVDPLQYLGTIYQ